ncbi:hypothetical protein MMC14_010344 [Varicellaria rhodocarpa]|nr:hypothetical protein [Varicellaria rhodocarpa]
MSAFQSTTLQVLKAHSVVYLGDVAYYIRNRIEYSLPRKGVATAGYVPVLVFNVNSTQPLTADILQNIFSRFEAEDDVFSQNFTEGSILVAQIQGGAREPIPTIWEL